MDKIEIVAGNCATDDCDYDSFDEFLRNIYIKGFKRGVERCKSSVSAAWIDIERIPYQEGFITSCTCGGCGYVNLGTTNYCPDCGRKMDLTFKNEKSRKMYETMARERIRKTRSHRINSAD